MHLAPADVGETIRREGYRVISALPRMRGFRRTPFSAYRLAFLVRFVAALRALRPDVVHAHDAAMLLPGAIGARWTGARLLYDSHELATGVPYRERLWPWFVFVLERTLIRRCDAVVTVSDGIADRLHERYDLDRRPVVLRNLPDLEIVRGAGGLRQKLGLPCEPLRVLYAGTIALAQGINNLVEAARSAGPDVVHVTVAGGGALVDELRELVERDRIANVQLLGSVASASIPALYERADVGAVLLRDLPVFRGAFPTKLLEVLAAGRPVVLSAAGESARFVTDHGVGVVVPPEDPAALAQAFRELQAADEEQFMALSQAAVRCAAAHDRSKATEWWLRLLNPGRDTGVSTAAGVAAAQTLPTRTRANRRADSDHDGMALRRCRLPSVTRRVRSS